MMLSRRTHRAGQFHQRFGLEFQVGRTSAIPAKTKSERVLQTVNGEMTSAAAVGAI